MTDTITVPGPAGRRLPGRFVVAAVAIAFVLAAAAVVFLFASALGDTGRPEPAPSPAPPAAEVDPELVDLWVRIPCAPRWHEITPC
jgi:hypothetical protein